MGVKKQQPRSDPHTPEHALSQNVPWQDAFLAALRAGATITVATQRAGIGHTTLYRVRKHDPAFAAAWADALRQGQAFREGHDPRGLPPWAERFFEHLRLGEPVSQAIQAAELSASRVYTERRRNPAFAAAWEAQQLAGQTAEADWPARLLTALREGLTIGQAAASLGISRRAVSHRQLRDAAFDAAIQEILQARRAREREFWQPRFLELLQEGLSIEAAADAAGVGLTMLFAERERNADFAARWEAIRPRRGSDWYVQEGWEQAFFDTLAAGSSLKDAAAAAQVSVSRIHDQRVQDASFDQEIVRILAERTRRKALWKDRFLAALADGLDVQSAARQAGVGLTKATQQRHADPIFNQQVKEILDQREHGWRVSFLAALEAGTPVGAAAAQAGVSLNRVYRARKRDPAFAAALTSVQTRQPSRQRPGWKPRFLTAIREGHPPTVAAHLVGIKPATALSARSRLPDFARAWDAALAESGRLPAKRPHPEEWTPVFLATLQAGATVAAAAAAAGVSLSVAKKHKRKDTAFATAWHTAIAQRTRRRSRGIRRRAPRPAPAAAPPAPVVPQEHPPQDEERISDDDGALSDEPLYEQSELPSWGRPFLLLVANGSTIEAAARQVGRVKQTVYRLRRQDPWFAQACEDALARGKLARARPPAWIPVFLEHVRKGASTGVAAQLSGIGSTTVFTYSQHDPSFQVAWDAARQEGKQNGSAELRRIRLPLPPAAAETFWAHVDRSGGPQACWLWSGRIEKGWGRFWYAEVYYQAQRAAYELTYGEIPPDLKAIPECGNRLCVNPDHVLLDGAAPPIAPRGEAHHQAKLSDEAVRAIRQAYATTTISAAELGRRYDVQDTTVLGLVRGDQRRSADGAIGLRPPKKKPKGYWNDVSTLEQELRAFLAELGTPGVLPSSRTLLQHGRADLLQAIRRHGGLLTVAARLQLATGSQPSKVRATRKPRGYWDAFETLERELLAFIEQHGHAGEMPSVRFLSSLGRADLKEAIRHHGGLRQVAAKLGLTLTKRVAGQRPGSAAAIDTTGAPEPGPAPAPPLPVPTEDVAFMAPPQRQAPARSTPLKRPASPGKRLPLKPRPTLMEARPEPGAPSEPAPLIESHPEHTPPAREEAVHDQTLLCQVCGESFIFSSKQQQVYRQHGWTNQPERCPACEQRKGVLFGRPRKD